MMALYYRDFKNGEAQEIDVALYESIFSLMESMVPEYDYAGVKREPTGSTLPGIVPSNIYKCKEGTYIVIAANGDNIFQRLLRVMDQDGLIGDERFLTNDKRVNHAELIDTIIQEWTSQYILTDCLSILNENGIPSGPIYSIEDIMKDPQYKSRDMILDIPHPDPEIGSLKVPGIVPKLSKTPGRINWLGPKLGEHNDEVLKDIGLTNNQIVQLREKGII
jgi:crotonobetainyl-CoA:carnitine CoA-transferase CaiB-like acyl-CoA transferase